VKTALESNFTGVKVYEVDADPSLFEVITEDDAKRLSELSLAGIKVIDSAFGESTGGSKEDMCRRIARLPLNRLSINTTELEVSGETVLQFKSRISKLKKVQLVKLCKTYSIPVGGDKKDIIKRLMKHKCNTNTAKEAQAKLKVLLQPTVQANDDESPPIISHYKSTFNSVDKFDQLLGYIKWEYRSEMPEFVWIVNCVRFAVLNAWVLYIHYNKITNDTTDEASLKEFVAKVAMELMDV